MATKDENYEYFKSILSTLLNDDLKVGKFVVVYDRQVKHLADTFQAALKYAVENFGANDFVVQQIIDETKFVNFLAKAV